MALTRSTVVANNDVAALTIVGANTDTVIQDSKPNEDMQAQEAEIDYEFDINNKPVDCNCVVVNNLTPTSEAEIKAEIAAIKTQRYRATIKCQLTKA